MSATAVKAAPREISWVVTTQDRAWAPQASLTLSPLTTLPDVMLREDLGRQVVEGFGVCFNELGWRALSRLSAQDRDAILHELFTPGAGTSFTLCRMPLGANDFSLDWYSYDEEEGDLALEHFSIANDRETLIPFIRAAQRFQPELRLWASPWSPPTWMKYNGHYAGARPWPGFGVENGLREDQVGLEGTDMMRQDAEYLDAYARYFGLFVDAYRSEGIRIETVMPQNEFNSPQVFPSCTWTPEGLARFITRLGPEMHARGVEVFFGTQERAAPEQFEKVLADPDAAPWIRGAGFQWAGKGAIADAHRIRPDLPLYQTEQECGDGRNDWRFCRYTWTLMKRFFEAGATGYTYWNLALDEGGVSRWGWAQNSLVVVEPETATYRFTHEFQLMRHLTHFLQPGAQRIETFSWSGFENQLAFRNPDGSVVVIMQNDMSEEITANVALGEESFVVTLPADSFSTFVIAA